MNKADEITLCGAFELWLKEYKFRKNKDANGYCTKRKRSRFNAHLKNSELAKIKINEITAGQIHYLDFETIMTALPLFENVAPYEQLLTQYSLHICSEPGKVIKHCEYLAGHDKDYRRELAEKLIEDLGKTGSIIVYHIFEKTMISGLIKLFPDLKTPLTKLIDRILDLKAIINKHFYHPGFHGSYSIKVVLPVLVAEMSYKNLTIKNGSEAIAAFVDMVKRRYTKTTTNKIRKTLLEYCAMDTMTMVKLHETLVEIAS